MVLTAPVKISFTKDFGNDPEYNIVITGSDYRDLRNQADQLARDYIAYNNVECKGFKAKIGDKSGHIAEVIDVIKNL